MEDVKTTDESIVSGNIVTDIKNWFSKNGVLLLSIIGILLSIELVVVYFRANFIAGAGPSFCTISDTINCDDVARSQFSHFLGIPLALYGLGFYFAITGLALADKLKKLPIVNALKNPSSCIFSLSFISVLVAVILAVISESVIHKICVLCFITYGVNLLIFAVSKGKTCFWGHFKNAFIDLKNIFSTKNNAILATIGVVAIVSLIGYFNFSGILVGGNKGGVTTGSEPTGNVLGSSNPIVVIDEYTDYECPYCSMSNVYLHRLIKEVDGVQVNHHDYPLNSECNPSMKKVIHPDACRAALYARAAKKQGKFWELASTLFDNQYNLSETMIITLARNLNLDVEKLKKDANAPENLAELKKDSLAATKRGVNATPTYFITAKGKTTKIEGLMSYPDFKKKIEELK